MFANATPERPALYFTVLGEPTIKMLRYQQQFEFFDPARVPSAVRFINLATETTAGDLDAVLRRIVAEVGDAAPAFVAVDSFRTIVGGGRTAGRRGRDRSGSLRQSARTAAHDVGSHLVLDRRIHRRGTATPGVHCRGHDPLVVRGRRSKLGDAQASRRQGARAKSDAWAPYVPNHGAGMQVFPRIPEQQRQRAARENKRLATGVPGLDEMTGGGIPAGDVVLLTGPAGKRQDHVRDALHRPRD
jgi:circadian clock protein KaiC